MDFIKRSFAAGMLIGLGGAIYISVSSRVLGAFLFCVGLFSVIVLETPLFTGKVGYVITKNGEKPFTLLKMLLINLLGAFATGLLAPLFLKNNNYLLSIVSKKMELSLLTIFVRAAGCGIMMLLALEPTKVLTGIERYFGVFLAVPVFILLGLEHVVADAFYFAAALSYAPFPFLDMLLFLFVAALGNSAGAILFRYLSLKETPKKTVA